MSKKMDYNEVRLMAMHIEIQARGDLHELPNSSVSQHIMFEISPVRLEGA